MTDYHNKAFYGQNSVVSITSTQKTVPYIFLSIMNRKADGTWESVKKGEGKTVKISIEEIICILEVLHKKSANWRGYHVFKERKTEIYVGWENDSRQVLQIKVGGYKKKFRFPNLEFLMLLLEHILNEKIEFATSGTSISKELEKSSEVGSEYSVFTEHITARDGLHIVETTQYGTSVDTIDITAKIKVESPKALLVKMESDQEFWIPKSTVHNEYDINSKDFQTLTVDYWIIEKHKILK
ncbi:MAG: hypothetical protein ACFFBI_01420 [Promethearchaeota archaeon]